MKNKSIDPYRSLLRIEGSLYTSQFVSESILESLEKVTDNHLEDTELIKFTESLPRILPLHFLRFSTFWKYGQKYLRKFISIIKESILQLENTSLDWKNKVGDKVLTAGFTREIRKSLAHEHKLDIMCYIPSNFSYSERSHIIKIINEYHKKHHHNISVISEVSNQELSSADAILITTYGIVENSDFPMAYLPRWIVDDLIAKVHLYYPNSPLYLVYHERMQRWKPGSSIAYYQLEGQPISTDFFRGFVTENGLIDIHTNWPRAIRR